MYFWDHVDQFQTTSSDKTHYNVNLPMTIKFPLKVRILPVAKMSLNSEKIKTQFSISLYASISQLYHAEMKTPSKLSIRFQRYSHFSAAQNNQIQKKLNPIVGSTYKSISVSSDSFCLITSHMSNFYSGNSLLHAR